MTVLERHGRKADDRQQTHIQEHCRQSATRRKGLQPISRLSVDNQANTHAPQQLVDAARSISLLVIAGMECDARYIDDVFARSTADMLRAQMTLLAAELLIRHVSLCWLSSNLQFFPQFELAAPPECSRSKEF